MCCWLDCAGMELNAGWFVALCDKEGKGWTCVSLLLFWEYTERNGQPWNPLLQHPQHSNSIFTTNMLTCCSHRCENSNNDELGILKKSRNSEDDFQPNLQNSATILSSPLSLRAKTVFGIFTSAEIQHIYWLTSLNLHAKATYCYTVEHNKRFKSTCTPDCSLFSSKTRYDV